MNQKKYNPTLKAILFVSLALSGFYLQDFAKGTPKKSSTDSVSSDPQDGLHGIASWYKGVGGGLTAAHRTLPFGSKVKVTNVYNGRSVIVTINDRGPFVRGRVIDVSSRAAQAIGIYDSGVGKVELQVVSGN